jgi:AGCS family alanine or glycine:cation symporter
LAKCQGNERKPKEGEDTHGITPFQAFVTGLASRVGVGNIAGVAIAIAIGGPGAVFWMWVTALLGMSSAFIESV